MIEEVELITDSGDSYRARLRRGNPADRAALVKSWVPMLERGPAHWLDREWGWDTFGESDLHLPRHDPEWLVLADELEPGARSDLLGVLVTTGPISATEAGLAALSGPAERLAADRRLLWVEYIASAPSVRPDCPSLDQRKPRLKGVGYRLMCAAIARSFDLGIDGVIGLHAEGPSASVYARWNMAHIGDAEHRAGDRFPVFFGDTIWASGFPDRTR